MRSRLICSFIATLAVATVSAKAADVLVVCPQAFRQALAPWEAYRRAQGHELLFVEPTATAAEQRAVVRQAAKNNQLSDILLIGDVPRLSDSSREAAGDSQVVPTWYVTAKVNIRWGSEPTIATDELYADLNDDRVPDVAVGRIPAHSSAELAAVVRKILRYEQSNDEGEWHRRINIVAGVGGFGTMTDALVEAAGRSVIQQTVPLSYEVSPLFASRATAKGAAPDQFTAQVLRQIEEGSLAWIYLGHGLPTELDSIRTLGGDRPILSANDVPQLRCGPNCPLAVLIACYTGAFDARYGCLAESLLLHEHGPVAAIAATRVTMPYGNAVFGCELLRSCYEGHPATLGEIWKSAQRRTLADAPDDPLRKSLDQLASGLSPPPVDLAAERREHVLMYQLLGDPLLRIQFPRELKLDAPTEATSGQSLTIKGRSEVAGRCTIELITNGGEESVSNAPAATIRLALPGAFQVTIDLPASSSGAHTVRGFVAGESEYASGATTVVLHPASTPVAVRATTTTEAR
jgi:hypothetical protein